MTDFKYQYPDFYSIFFYGLEKGPFGVPPGRTIKDKNPVPVSPKLYVLQGEIMTLCYVNCHIYFTLLLIKFLLIIFKMRLHLH